MMLKHTGEFDLAFCFVNETSQNIFLTGKAGTGKTTFLKYLRENTSKESIVAAPTGVAAINARGVTLHSLFQLPFGIILPEIDLIGTTDFSPKTHPLLSKIRYNKEKLELLRSIELLIIDESSMVASYTVDAINSILRYIRRRPEQLFGGVQILFIGDLYQLPPVVKKDEWEILQQYYSSIFFFDSFALRDNIPVIIEFKEIFRQKDDKFIEILNGIRNNNISEENFKLLNGRRKNNISPINNEEYITLTTHNSQSDEINQRKLSGLPEHSNVFYADIEGEFPEHSYPAEKELRLKTGAQVMFLRNDNEGKLYFNGKIGTITKLYDDCIKVKCKDDTFEIEVKKTQWENINYKVNPETWEITEEVLGTFIQYPLRLAWAITIHKSQGLTFEKVIIDAARAFTTGQVYVALSRCTSLEGLILKSPIYKNFLGAHRDLKEWQSKNLNEDLSKLFTEARQDFILEEIQNIFTWKSWYIALKDLNLYVLQNQEKVQPESILWITRLMEKQKELYEVSEKFKEMIIHLRGKEFLIERNDHLQKRIKDGANYFYKEINEWKEIFFNHPLSFETKKLSRKADSLLEEINYILEVILNKINYCLGGFFLDDYLKNGKVFKGTVKEIKSAYGKRKTAWRKNSSNTIEETVNILREGKTIQQISDERELKPGTIESHLAKAVRWNLIEAEEIIPADELKKIAQFIPENLDDISLAEIKEKAPSEISYGELRIVLAWLEKTNKRISNYIKEEQ
ncbi:MAG: helix-turn-helix domain-containing protein [Ignavibacteriaceae bacterium]